METLRLTKERLKNEWTQEDVAKKIGTTKQAVCNWENGRGFPRRPVLLKLENLFNLTHQQLFAPDAEEDPFSSTN